jgi:NADH-quinone oxidoreductase subunit M
MLSFTRRTFFGPITQSRIQQLQDLRPRELTLLSIPAFLIVLWGFVPNSVLKTNQAATELWLARLFDQPVLQEQQLTQLDVQP